MCSRTKLGCVLLAPSAPSQISSSAPLERYVCSLFLQGTGGLYIGGTATLINTNVYSNVATVRCLPCAPKPFLQCPAGTLRVLAFYTVHI